MKKGKYMEPSFDKEPSSLRDIDWKNLSVDNISEDLFFTIYFLETRKHFEDSFSWLRWLDLDTLEMLSSTFKLLCEREKRREEDVLDEESDFFCLCLAMYAWQNEESFPPDEKLEPILNVFGHCITLLLLERQGKVKLDERGSGNVFKGDSVFDVVKE